MEFLPATIIILVLCFIYGAFRLLRKVLNVIVGNIQLSRQANEYSKQWLICGAFLYCVSLMLSQKIFAGIIAILTGSLVLTFQMLSLLSGGDAYLRENTFVEDKKGE